MLLAEFIEEAKSLSRADQLRLIQALAEQLATDERDLIPPGVYPVWSPIDAHEAANILLQVLDDDKARQ